MKKTRNERLEITLCGRPVASFENEADLMRTAAARITEWDAEAQKHANRTVELALAIGATLLAVKGKLPHGAFMLWVSQNCGSVSHTTATRYMALAEAAARRFALGEAADDPAAGEEAQKAVADQAAETERHFERSLSRLYLDWGIVSRPKGEHSWGGDRSEKAAANGHTVGRRPKGSAEEVEAALDAAANYEPAMWASAEGAIKTVADLDAEKQLFSRLEDGHLAMAAQMLGDLARKAGEALKARLARRDMGLHGGTMGTGEVVRVLEGGL